VLLEDCSSAVGGFEAAASAFVAEMKAAGVTVTTSDQLTWDA
jgi:nicotinamidase-related amidase